MWRKQPKRAPVDWTTVDFWTFLGLILYFGVVKYPQRWMPWGDDPMFKNDFVAKLMAHVLYVSYYNLEKKRRWLHFS